MLAFTSLLAKFIPTNIKRLGIYMLIAIGCVISHVIVYKLGKSNTKEVAALECIATQQQDQIQIQNDNIKLIQKAKQIHIRNADLERDTLIDQL